MLTHGQLRQIMPGCPNPDDCAQALTAAMAEGGLVSALVQAAFLAEGAYESNQCSQMVEVTDGSAYEKDLALGNTEPGDGFKYRGRGFFQITGRDNYTRCGHDLGLDLQGNPDLAATSPIAFRVAVWYWNSRGLSLPASLRDLAAVTKGINGEATIGPPSYQEIRRKYYARALAALGVSA